MIRRPTCARALLGFGLLGFTSIYREGFEIVIFLQNLRVTFGSSVVLEGVALGALFTAAVGVLTFSLHQKLPYKRLLIITGAMLLVVLFVMVGEEVNEMQLAGWIGTTSIGNWPGWLGQWFSLFPNVQTIVAQVGAVVLVLGSYLLAEYLRVWRPRRRGLKAATFAERAAGRRHGRGLPHRGDARRVGRRRRRRDERRARHRRSPRRAAHASRRSPAAAPQPRPSSLRPCAAERPRPVKLHGHARLAQLVAHLTCNEAVVGSSPTAGFQKTPAESGFVRAPVKDRAETLAVTGVLVDQAPFG